MLYLTKNSWSTNMLWLRVMVQHHLLQSLRLFYSFLIKTNRKIFHLCKIKIRESQLRSNACKISVRVKLLNLSLQSQNKVIKLKRLRFTNKANGRNLFSCRLLSAIFTLNSEYLRWPLTRDLKFSKKGLTLETSALEALHDTKFTLSTRLIETNYTMLTWGL